MQDQIKRWLPVAIPVVCVGVYAFLAPVPTAAMAAVNVVVKYNAHKGLSAGGRLAVFALMNAVLCASMGLVCTLYASLTGWMLAAAAFTLLFAGESRRKKRNRRRRLRSYRTQSIFEDTRYDDDIIDVTPVREPEAVETRM